MVDAGGSASSLELVVGGIAHEIRGPLATIAALAERCSTDTGGGPHVELARQVVDEAVRLERLLTSLLDVLLAGADAAAGRGGWCLLEEVVDGALRTAALPDGDLRLHIPDSLPLVWADPVLAERIVANLLANADRHGTPPVEVSARLRTGGVELTIADAGPGPVPREGGRGLGLTLSMHLARSQGLLLELPREGDGSRFRLVFPRVLPAGLAG